MKKKMFYSIFFFIISSVKAQNNEKENKLLVAFGTGVSYSLYYKFSAPDRSWGSPNIENKKSNNNVYAFAHFVELGWRLKNPRWTLRFGYASQNFFPLFKTTGYTAEGSYFNIDTKEIDKNTYLNLTLQCAILTGKNRLEIGSGVYTKLHRKQQIEYYRSYQPQSGAPPASAILIEDTAGFTSIEGGFPLNVDYLHTLKSGVGLGCRLNFNYSQSIQQPEHVAVFIFIKARLK